MADLDWGGDEARYPHAATWLGPRVIARAEDLPGIEQARAEGFGVLDDSPMWSFLPYVWPEAHRAWIPDHRVLSMTWSCTDGTRGERPLSVAEIFEVESDCNVLLEEWRVPARPSGRVWLLRSPRPGQSLNDAQRDLLASWKAAGGDAYASRGFVQHVRRALRGTDPSQD